MKNILRSIVAAAFAVLLVTGGSVPSDAVAAPARASAFDGDWSVVIYTLRGDCDRSLRYRIRIVGGRVQNEQASYQVAGLVSPSGAIRVVVAEGGRSASGQGRLSGNVGRGLWRTDTGQCSGQWTAERRAANF